MNFISEKKKQELLKFRDFSPTQLAYVVKKKDSYTKKELIAELDYVYRLCNLTMDTKTALSALELIGKAIHAFEPEIEPMSAHAVNFLSALFPARELKEIE